MRLIYFILILLLIFWALGTFAWAAGSLIHLLLVVAVIVFLIDLLGGRRL